MLTKQEAEAIYNKLEYYTAIGTDKPWWQLTDREMEYYQWLFGQDRYYNSDKT
jgi:hypothetical protein